MIVLLLIARECLYVFDFVAEVFAAERCPMNPPNPGSDRALDQGCTCPVLDNAHGRGVFRGGDKVDFIMSLDCPLHGGKDLVTRLAAAREKPHLISKYCVGVRCQFAGRLGEARSTCEVAAQHKVEETIFDDDPNPARHNLTAYLCCKHFGAVMGTSCKK